MKLQIFVASFITVKSAQKGNVVLTGTYHLAIKGCAAELSS